jgi:alkaline phosphatase D
LEAIAKLKPDFFVGTGDNVYFDHPQEAAARTQVQVRKKYHEQFVQARFGELFSAVPTYWEKDDHDFRYDDADNTGDTPPSPELGKRTFMEQLPVIGPGDKGAMTYRTHRVNRDLQIWLVEGRDYRSPNNMPDGPGKSIWGDKQKEWLKRTLLESDATFKILISPTPMVGPDDVWKRDNHTNPQGFRYEGEQFFQWLGENGFLEKGFYIVCGDRHWQYHSVHPRGFEEFSCGALVDANARIGRAPGDPRSTDPDGLIKQPYIQPEAGGGFLRIKVASGADKGKAAITFEFYKRDGKLLYECRKER